MKHFSKKRESIYKCICSTHSHPSAEWIYNQLKPVQPELSLSTVYRNLLQFKKDGLIRNVCTVDGQERFDANTNDHAHFICSKCSSVLDLDIPFLENKIADFISEYSSSDFESCEVILRGICEDCKNTF